MEENHVGYFYFSVEHYKHILYKCGKNNTNLFSLWQYKLLSLNYYILLFLLSTHAFVCGTNTEGSPAGWFHSDLF